MSSQGDNDHLETLKKKHNDLVAKLYIDVSTAQQSWDAFKEIASKYSLVGDPFHWFACSIYTISRKSFDTATTNKKKPVVNITKLLRASDLSFKQFLIKIRAWANMSKLTTDYVFMEHIQKEDQHFHVVLNVYSQYHLWFNQIFQEPEMESNGAKTQSLIPTTMQLYDFVWTLFVHLKSKLNHSSDLVKCMQIMASCLDIAYANVLQSKLQNLLNENYEGLSQNCGNPNQSNSSILHKLLGANESSLPDAIHTKEYIVVKGVEKLIVEKTLKGENCFRLLEKDNFQYNFSTVRCMYDKYVIRCGVFDERIFLAEAQRQFMMKTLCANGEYILETPKSNSTREARSFIRDTPLTGRSYISPRESDVPSNSADSLSRIKKMLENSTQNPPEALIQLFLECKDDPMEKITSIVENLNNLFSAQYDHSDIIEVLSMWESLFYKLLQNIINFEKKNTEDLSALLDKAVFHECLSACSLQIILDAKKSMHVFPWILGVLNIQPACFVRVIELVVRSTDAFSRDTVKHLSTIEESILDKHMWTSSSGLWRELATFEIPKFEDVALPGTLDSSNSKKVSLASSQTSSSSAIETFQSPVRNIKPGQSLLNSNRTTHFLITDANGSKTLIPIEQTTTPTPPEVSKPKKITSLGIIFRKMYYLAHVRMDHLCQKLGITDVDLKRKIWTVFEYSVMKHTNLFRDRHLDQLIMCAVYIICRITEQPDKKFSEILKCYRCQPQAKSEIYRVVFIKKKENGEEEFSNLIVFYNDIYVSIMKKFIAKFSDTQTSNDNLPLSTFPATKLQIASPKRQISNTVYLRTHESPVQEATGDKYHCYYFSRSAATDLRDLNNAINKKRPLNEMPEGRIIKKLVTRKMQALIEERKVQNNIE